MPLSLREILTLCARPAHADTQKAGTLGAPASWHPSDRGLSPRRQARALAFGLRTNSVSVCSSSMPLVSGIFQSTNTNDSSANRA